MPLLYIDLIEGRDPSEVRALQELFYKLLASNLAERCGLDPADLIVSITENNDEDWSFGHGRAQFLTGELQ
ncbi:tautomerase family protein [Mycobacterium parmense]|uniref:Tautomerase n=1 Tax=Mycobacterium parmense TaxID=185642 RepID=A0A7I7YQ71_9MYCO|nr:tautomerase family protein [Mycobacterium parmense]MCV7353421.1 tautomerase family protein [Mycobacterium parmense]BBZ44018.1 hypothetical protein MPRM_12990 [Mycobacterium parmense]